MGNYLYNPDQKSRDQLKEEFVVRTKIFDDLMNEIERSDMKNPEQHYLLVGQRGTGKTTMLLRLRYAIEDSEKLNSWLLPVGFNEEQYNITELASLWINIAEYLEDNHEFEGLAGEMENLYGNEDFEEKCYETLEKALKKEGKKIVLLIDNIGDLFHKFDEKEVRRLREILQTRKYIRLIAGSPFYLDTVLDYSQPFFEFFKVKRLEGLSEEEAKLLLRKLGDLHNEREKIEHIIRETPQRIETLRILTSGVPRTIALLFQIFIDHEHESSLKDLMRILDVVTPLYKHRMDDLPTQQQKIVDAVARNWDAVSVKQLASKLRMESKVISAQLRQLEKNQVIEKRQTSTKNHLYLLQDRFWNIWYLMRNGRKRENERVIWLVRFLESWCSIDDFEKRIATYVKQIKEGQLDDNTKNLYGRVYSSLKNLTTSQKYSLRRTVPSDISESIRISEIEAVEEYKKLSTEDNHIEAIKALLESDTLSLSNKKLISHAIKSANYTDVLKFVETLLSDDKLFYLEKKPGYITLLLDTYLNVILRKLVSENYDSLLGINETIFELVKIFKTYELDYEYEILRKIATSYLFFKKMSLAKDLFQIFEEFELHNKEKIIYEITLALEKGENNNLNYFGNEITEPMKKIMEQIMNFWKLD